MRRSFEAVEAVERRRRVLRMVLFAIILATLPFYCIGFVLWGTAPKASETTLQPATATLTPIPLLRTTTATLQPTFGIGATSTFTSPLQPTPFQFVPPPVFNTATLIPPTVSIPSPTNAPPLTFPPSLTPVPQPTNTPQPTITPQPTNTQAPTDTPPPTPTDTLIPPPTDTLIPPPSDTPIPSDTPSS